MLQDQNLRTSSRRELGRKFDLADSFEAQGMFAIRTSNAYRDDAFLSTTALWDLSNPEPFLLKLISTRLFCHIYIADYLIKNFDSIHECVYERGKMDNLLLFEIVSWSDLIGFSQSPSERTGNDSNTLFQHGSRVLTKQALTIVTEYTGGAPVSIFLIVPKWHLQPSLSLASRWHRR